MDNNAQQSSRRLLYLSGVLVLLIAIAALAGVFSSDVSTMESPSVTIDRDGTDAFSIEADGETLSFVREGDNWQMREPVVFPADGGQVNRFLSALESMETGALVTENPGRHGVYGIDDSAAVWVQAGDELDLAFGGKSSTQRGEYVRIGDDPRVFKLARPFPITLVADQWRDKVILPSEAASATRLTIRRPEGAYALESGDGGWMFGDGDGADSTSVAQLISRYRSLRASGFVDTLSASAVRSEAQHQITLGGDMPQANFEVFYKGIDDTRVAVATGGADHVYWIPASRLESLVPPASAFGR